MSQIEPIAREFHRRVLAWFLLALLTLVAIGFFTYRSIIGLVEENHSVAHTHEVLETLGNILSDVKDVQSAQRGYVITGQEEYLVPYDIALPKIATNLNHLQTLTQDNFTQQERIPALRTKVAARLATAAEILNTYDASGERAAMKLVRTGIGKKSTDEIRMMVAEMETTERLLLERRQEIANRATFITLAGCGLGLLACMAILSGVFWLIRRESRLRLKSEQSLQEAAQTMARISADTRAVGQMGDFLQSCRTAEEAHAFISENLPSLFTGSVGSLALLNNSHDFLETVLSWGQDHLNAVQFAPEECWALRRGRLHRIDDRHKNPRCPHIHAVSGASLCVPMMAHGETMGVLYLASPDPEYFSDYRIEMLRTVTEQISLALANLKLQETLRVQSIRDPLTKLFNRRYMEATLLREFSRARRDNRPVSILMIDVDHFKRFNDTHGHEAGDMVLTEVGRLLQRQVRAEDIPCRYGGEEFLLVLLGAGETQAAIKAEQIRAATEELVLQHNRQALQSITLSIGVATFPTQGEQSETVIAAADAALYQAKHAGRNRVMVAGASAHGTALAMTDRTR